MKQKRIIKSKSKVNKMTKMMKMMTMIARVLQPTLMTMITKPTIRWPTVIRWASHFMLAIVTRFNIFIFSPILCFISFHLRFSNNI